MSFNLKTAKKQQEEINHIEQRLKDESPKSEPTSTEEVQLEDYRAKSPESTTESQLEDSRKKNDKEGLTETRLNDSKSNLVKHRNEEASKGNVNKLEEQRLAGKNSPVQESEKSETSSETPKNQQFTKKTDENGLRLAQVLAEPGLSEDLDASLDEAFGGDSADPNLDFVDDQLGQAFDQPDETQDEDFDGALVEEKSPNQIDQGGTKIQTGVISFMLSRFDDGKGNVDRALLEEKVMSYLASKYSIKTPSLGTVRSLAGEGIGQVGYMAPLTQ
jgi:superfamily II DNA/RNA helicase